MDEQPVAAPQGILSKTLAWIMHPMHHDEGDLADYVGFLVLALIAGLLWAKVVRQTLEAV